MRAELVVGADTQHRMCRRRAKGIAHDQLPVVGASAWIGDEPPAFVLDPDRRQIGVPM